MFKVPNKESLSWLFVNSIEVCKDDNHCVSVLVNFTEKEIIRHHT